MPEPAAPGDIYVDADACPVKREVYKVAERHGLTVHVVSNGGVTVPRSPRVKMVIVGDAPDAADDWIAARAGPGDIVVTADIPLASRCVKAGAAAISPKGRVFTQESMGMVLATRNLMTDLRAAGEVTGGPRPFSPRDRSAFLSALHEAAVRSKRVGGT
jgi:uncharacterized protein